jgi:ankyrin repeat protein
MRRVIVLALCVAAAGVARAAEQTAAERFANAVESADLAAVKALVEEGHPVDMPIAYVEKDATPLYKAAGKGRTEIVRYLIAHGANVNYRGAEWGHTPLSEAAGSGFDDVVDILIKAGADPKVKDRNGYTAFAIAALGGQFDMAETLLKYSDVNGADSYGNTLLMAATTTGETEAIRWLVGKGADVNKVSQLEYGGRTALVSAAEVGAVESARTLLELGANPHLKI